MPLLTSFTGVGWVCEVLSFWGFSYLNLSVGFKGSEHLTLLHGCVLRFTTDPYSRDEEMEFRKWCAMLLSNCCITEFLLQRCHVLGYGRTNYIATYILKSHHLSAGPEHHMSGPGTGKPSYCMLPMFHAPRISEVPVGSGGYISADGHAFNCKSPAEIQQGFHVYACSCLAVEDSNTSTPAGYLSSTGQVNVPDG